MICTILYVLVAAVVTGLVRCHAELNVPDPDRQGRRRRYRNDLVLGAHQDRRAGRRSLTTVILVLLYGQSRVFFTIAKDGLLPKMFSEVHPTLGTPYKSQLLIGIVVAIVAALTPIDVLGEMVSIGTLFARSRWSAARWSICAGAMLEIFRPGSVRPPCRGCQSSACCSRCF